MHENVQALLLDILAGQGYRFKWADDKLLSKSHKVKKKKHFHNCELFKWERNIL